ncbi:hypothetical protein AMTR_s00052p00105440 [Amborella trichopoda]|uniref:Uncharacterized protein n=1 Tax=Amborella trichopoda TaxID=13333 RepID=U5D1T0_AMBTC|nr:hypothetical protein AMTR_s00052p00105440 [Amborella trichopoda]
MNREICYSESGEWTRHNYLHVAAAISNIDATMNQASGHVAIDIQYRFWVDIEIDHPVSVPMEYRKSGVSREESPILSDMLQ